MACPCPCCGKTGACCVGATCTQETCADCEALGGDWQGYDTECDGTDCPCDPPADHTLCEKCVEGVVTDKCGSGQHCCDGVCQDEPCESVSGLSLFARTDCEDVVRDVLQRTDLGHRVVQVWRKAIGHCGIGDCLRGALELQRLTGELRNDYSGHPVAEFVRPDVTVASDIAPLLLIHVGSNACLPRLVQEWKRSDRTAVLFSNAGAAWYAPLEFSAEDRRILQSMLVPTESAELDLLNERYRMPPEYRAFQFRTLDDREPDKALIDACIAQVPNEPDVWVLASSELVRNAIKAARPKVFTFDATIAHTGKQTGPGIKQSLLEFWLLGQAKSLHAFTVYEWVSNYAVFAAARGNVPIHGSFLRRFEGHWYAANGVGTHLKALLGRMGIHPTKKCSCTKRAAEMDYRGVQWCEDNIDTISGWMESEARKRKLPYMHIAGKALIRMAIRAAKKC